ncbi:MAG: DSD1 family PLP-dependent enzyme [Gammaproteobacteria bacterium]|nr:DSD1 family PLP-dependent enzyme [Gammaproteobacteria bacterium]
MVNRRALLLGGLAASGAGALFALRPANQGAGGHAPYFAQLNTLLRKAGEGHPTMIIDLEALDHNIQMVKTALESRDLRIVAKSVPSAALIDYISHRSQSNKLMAFHEPFLNAMGRSTTDILFGKPMPIAAAAQFYDRPARQHFDPSEQLQWLIDTPQRLDQYAALAKSKQVSLRVNIEIDVGLHRGGIGDPAMLLNMLKKIDDIPELSFSGLMGYDPHVVKMPALIIEQQTEFQRVQQRYQQMLEVARPFGDDLTLNAAGSPTYKLWQEVEGIANELSVGSGFVKPLDFDIPSLAAHMPAIYIATPVLKSALGTRTAGVNWVGEAQSLWNPNRAQTIFVYGGYWKAKPVSPRGLITNPLFGRSSNQEMLNASAAVNVKVDDYVFYRPTQSESVMLQFGEILAVRNGQIQHRWSPFSWS